MLRSKHRHLLRGRTDHHGSATTTAADKHTQALVPRKFLGVLSLPHVNMLALSRPPESRGGLRLRRACTKPAHIRLKRIDVG